MLRLLWAVSVRIRYYLRRYMPTNILLDAIRTRRGLKWGIPAMLLAVPYLIAASICTNLIGHGGPGWLNLLVILFIWNAMKMAWIGPVSSAQLVRVRIRERRVRSQMHEIEPIDLLEEATIQSAPTSSTRTDAAIHGRM